MKEKAIQGLTLGTILIMVFVVFAGIPMNVSAASTLHVGSGQTYSTIQSAIDAADSGDTIYVHAGTYYEHLTISKSITLEGVDRETTIIDGSGSGSVVYVTTHYVTIGGLKITNGENGIEMPPSGYISHFTIQDTIIDSNSLYGIYEVHTGGYWLIENCIISNNGLNGLRKLHQFHYSTIQNCEVFGNGGSGLSTGWGHNTLLTNNIVHDNAGSGIYLDSMTNTIVENNEVYNNNIGIHMGYVASYNTIKNNIIYNNIHGLGIESGTGHVNGNNIYHNDIIDNDNQVWNGYTHHLNDQNWDNGYPSGGNYWSDYTGTDTNADGIGDIPYWIYGVTKDNYPLMRPWNNQPPVADANGPYEAYEGSSINFDASGSSDPNNDDLQYRWDFNNDATWDTDWSDSPYADYTWYDDYSGTVVVEVSDGMETDTAEGTVTVNNAAPVVNAGLDQTVTAGDPVSFSGSFSDPGTGDTHEKEWDFGDEATTTNTLTPTHVYHNKGDYTVTLTVTDDDDGEGADTLTITVNPIPVTIDIKPGSDPNSINLKSEGKVPVAVLTTDDFYASDIDPETVKFAGASPVKWAMEDVDDDNDKDMLFHFNTHDLDLDKDSTEATLGGKIEDGSDFEGTDSVNIVPKKK